MLKDNAPSAALKSLCVLATLGASFAHADDQLSTVVVQATKLDVESAMTQAPTLTPLDVTQPTVDLSRYFIQNNMPLTSNFSEIIGIAQSVQAVSPNGTGLMENQILSIRGFVDGYYNVTFDGIPFQDSNDFTHHSTSYFMTHDLGGVNIDYGPGTAATIGNATFCCTVENVSKAPTADPTLTPYLSYGSFDTQVYGAEFDTGRIEKFDGAAGYIDAESSSSSGELSYMGQQRKNVFSKFNFPLGSDTVLTMQAMYNQIHQYVGLGATAAQIAQFGPTYGLVNDPSSQDYYGYNLDQIHTDFEYVGIASRLNAWTLDNKVYTYGYYHNGYNGEDPNGETPNGTYYSVNDVPGNDLINDYRSWGDTFSAKYSLPFGDVKSGIWADRQSNERALWDVDETLGGGVNPFAANCLNDPPPTPGAPCATPVAQPGAAVAQPTQAGILGAYYRLLDQKLTTLQPYFMVDWTVLPSLTVSPGVRYDHFERDVNAIVNVKTATAQDYDNTYSATLPSLLVHYAILDNWIAYAQAAKGFMAPNENYFNHDVPGSTNLAPQETWSYQTGTTWQTRQLSASADLYYIHFGNEIFSEKFGADTIFFNGGGTNYKGVEANATYYLGAGVSLYSNGSINRARVIENLQSNCVTGNCTGGLWVPNAPNATLSYGVIYNLYGIYASLLNKRVGHTYGDVGETQPISSYSTLNAAVGYTFGAGAGRLHDASVRVEVSNVLDKTPIIALAGYTSYLTTPLYWTNTERQVSVTLEWPL